MIPVDNAVFPLDIAYGSSGGAEFRTEVVTLGDGKEQRNHRWRYPRERWDVAYGVKTDVQLLALRAFFAARGGRTRGFLFQNHRDHVCADGPIGFCNGTVLEFQLCKSYADISGPVVFTRRLTRPKVGTLVVRTNGVVATDYICDYTTGLITFGAAPEAGVWVSASCEFYVPMRFLDDVLSMSLDDYLSGSCSVSLQQVRE